MALGGVGSYLLNLSGRLVARGHRVVVAAPPGELTPRLAAAGITWCKVRISDWHLLRARRELASVIELENVDLVCGHDYSAGAAAYLAARKAAVPYLLTVHCRRPAWQRFLVFYWSPKVVTVSCSLRESLTRQLGLPPERVIESYVGVDPVRFQPGAVNPLLLKELGMSPGRPVVLHVSRLSPTKSPVAVALAQAAERLVALSPDLAVLLVGSGEDEAAVRDTAARANVRIGKAVVRALGARGDIPDLMRLATVVVGTGTVALEAMASGRPVIAAGKGGLVGLLTPQTFPGARKTLFGDHGGAAPLASPNFVRAIAKPLSDPRLCARLGNWGHKVIAEQFSLEGMTDHVQSVYTDVLNGGAAQGRREPCVGALSAGRRTPLPDPGGRVGVTEA
jgi:glycosyltransferase involved in cell wall biosynthesis